VTVWWPAWGLFEPQRRFAQAASSETIDAGKAEMSRVLRRRRHIAPGADDDFSVTDLREVQALLQTVTGLLATLLGTVAAISLLVGGIGIMNIMLISVTERIWALCFLW
jgi:putative ABC transport system permease protein